jgi:hypothetical protein
MRWGARLKRLFVIKTRFEAWAVIYAVAVGASSRGITYLDQFPGAAGWMMFAASNAVVFIVGAFILDHVRPKSERSLQDQSGKPEVGTA